MSSLLPFALLATFGAVVFAAIAVGLAGAERRKAVEMLETQVGRVDVTLRQQELSKSFADRAMLPLVSGVAGVAKRAFPSEARARIERQLALAGRPEGWDAEKVMAYKVIGAVVMLALGLVIAGGGALPGGIKVFTLILTTFIGFYAPTAVLTRKAEARQEEMQRTLPDTMDLLTISVEAGLGFDSALMHVIQNVPGALSKEFSRLLQEMRLGVSRADAFRHMADRTDVEELNSFIVAMVQADTFGVSISKVLRAQAHELRTKRRQRAEEKAMKIPIKILFPLILCILPALFVVILGPGAIRIAENLFGIAP